MTKKLPQIEIDTVVIINAHELEYWEFICNAYKIVVPAYILENEAFYFKSEHGKNALKPTEWLQRGKITRLDAAAEDVINLYSRLSSDFMASLDKGEIEALAILLSKQGKNILFTTADRAAIKALGILGCGERGISVEELLKNKGYKLKNNQKLHLQYTKKWFQQVLAEGLSERNLWIKN